VVGAAATAGTAAFGALGRVPARAATAPPFLGSYEGVAGQTTNQWFTEIKAVVPGLNGFRQYDRKPFQDSAGWHNQIATAWPPLPYTGCPSVFSIYPLPDTVIAGDSDTMNAIDMLMSKSPPNSYLSAWHEYGNIDWLKMGYPGVTAEKLYQVHQILVGIAAKYPVTYGPILFAPKLHDYNSLVSAFTSCPPGMGFYGVDVYGNNGTAAGLCQLEKFIELAKPLDPHYPDIKPQLLIAETNTPLPETFAYTQLDSFTFIAGKSDFDNGQPVELIDFEPGVTYYVLNANGDQYQLSDTSFGKVKGFPAIGTGLIATRSAPRAGAPGTGWFESVCARMKQYGPKAIGALTYWNVTGALSGGFLPNDADGAIDALNYCINKILPDNGATYTLPPC